MKDRKNMDISDKMLMLKQPLVVFFGKEGTTAYNSFRQASRLDYYTDDTPEFYRTEDKELYSQYAPKGTLPDVLLFTRYYNKPLSLRKFYKKVDFDTTKQIKKMVEKY